MTYPDFFERTSRMPKRGFHQTVPGAVNQPHCHLLHCSLEVNGQTLAITRVNRAPQGASRSEELHFFPGERVSNPTAMCGRPRLSGIAAKSAGGLAPITGTIWPHSSDLYNNALSCTEGRLKKSHLNLKTTGQPMATTDYGE